MRQRIVVLLCFIVLRTGSEPIETGKVKVRLPTYKKKWRAYHRYERKNYTGRLTYQGLSPISRESRKIIIAHPNKLPGSSRSKILTPKTQTARRLWQVVYLENWKIVLYPNIGQHTLPIVIRARKLTSGYIVLPQIQLIFHKIYDQEQNTVCIFEESSNDCKGKKVGLRDYVIIPSRIAANLRNSTFEIHAIFFYQIDRQVRYEHVRIIVILRSLQLHFTNLFLVLFQ